MKAVDLNAYNRSLTGRGGNKKVRAAGRIPAVIYGHRSEPLIVEVERKDLEHLIHHSVSETKLVDLTISGDDAKKRLVLLKDVQHHPLSGDVLHVDLHEVAEDEKVTAVVPVETTGEAVGVKTGGGVLEHVLFRVRIRALPRDLVEFINVDVSHMNIDETLHIGEIPAIDGVEIMADSGIPVVSIAAPRKVEDKGEEAEEAKGEPEMIKEKKDDEGSSSSDGGSSGS